MLYNKAWDAKTVTSPDVFSLESLIAWLEKQPARKTYCYADTGHCLLAQYFEASGRPAASLGNTLVAFRDEDFKANSIPESFQQTAVPTPHTFGSALKRARKAHTHSL